MGLFSLLNQLMLKDIAFKVEEGKLRYSDDHGAMTEELRMELLSHRSEFGKITSLGDSFRLAPVSPAQKAMWMIHQFDPAGTAYNTVLGLRLSAQVDEYALEQACQQVTDRHSSLRSVFRSAGPDVLQVIYDRKRVHWQVYDCRTYSEERARAEMTRCGKMPFRLDQGPLFRAELFRLADSSCLVLTAHHIIMDAWSYHLIVGELETCYRSWIQGREAVLAPLSYPYEDYVKDQQRMLMSPQGESLAAYWCRRLSGELPEVRLPADYPRKTVQKGNGDSVSFEVDSGLLTRLSQSMAGTGCSLYVTLLAAYLVLLHRFTGQDELLVGTPATGRTNPSWTGVVGYFINAVVIRADCGGEPSFSDFARQVKQTVLEALEHQEYPFALLLDKLGLKPDASRQQLLQVMFVFIDDIRKAQQAGSTATELWMPFDLPSEEGQNDLMLVMTKLGERFAGAFRYDADLFEKDTILRMAGCFVTLLQSIAEQPQLPISRLALLSPPQRLLLLEQWNDTTVPYPREYRLHELFELQAARTPHALAAQDSTRSLTYAQLNSYANEVAQALLDRGASPDERICILADRSCDFLIAILGVFKSGAAYIPLDPKHPASRHLGIIRDSKAKVLLTGPGRSLSNTGEHPGDCPVLPIHMLYGRQEDCGNPGIRVTGDHLAYVIYTSGSTGKPKGAMVEHRGMLNHLYAKINEMSLGPGDVVVQNASQCFDISVWQFLSAIVMGGTTRIMEDGLVMDPVPFLEAVASSGATVLEMVPSLLHAVLDVIGARADLAEKLHSLRWMMVTGEALPPNLCARWFNRYPSIPLINAYGPTECSDDVTHYVLHAPPPPHTAIMPIGRAIQNTRLFILDRYLEPVPAGVIGELYVAGEGVGRGYLNDPERTQSAFLRDHLSTVPGGRLYRTGDRARYLPGGDIEYHGRIDHQVKVRGFRIELGEIEAAMQKLPGLKDAVAVARGENLDDKMLVAFWLAVEDRPDSTATGRQREYISMLVQSLPEYMVPTVWVQLRQFPLSPNGKIDRNWLTAQPLSEITKSYGVSEQSAHLAQGIKLEEQDRTGMADPGAGPSRKLGPDGHEAGTVPSFPAAEPVPQRLDERELLLLLQGWLDRDIGAVIAGLMNKSPAELNNRANLIENGFNSIKFISLSAKLEEMYNVRIAPPQFFDFATANGIIRYLMGSHLEELTTSYADALRQRAAAAAPDVADQQNKSYGKHAASGENVGPAATATAEREYEDWMDSAVAVIGMDARTPGAGSVSELWNNLIHGIDVITEIPEDRWNWRKVSGEHTKARWGGFIADVDRFDAGFFGIPAKRAIQMDPQQRLMLETAWGAVEDAGYKMSQLAAGRAGVFTAVAYTDYMDVLRQSGFNFDLHAAAGMERTLIPNMISHYFDLTGPSEAVDTACSSSLTALSRGVEALRSGACDTAIVGASNLILSPRLFMVFDELGKLSSDGRCKTFDKTADGYVRAEGVISVVLKPLKAAIADHDHIHAVIRGCVTRHVGRSSSFTAPKASAQSELLKETCRLSGVELCSLDYVEVHGPGISLVDAVEVNALNSTMKETLARMPLERQAYSCGIGSVKSNLGHMEAAGGLAGLLKVILSMQHGVIPGNVNISELNPYLELEDSPLYIVKSNTSWKPDIDPSGVRRPRRAGISSFGGGGVIAHAVVEEYINPRLAARPPVTEGLATKTRYAIPLSARCERSLHEYAVKLAEFVGHLVPSSPNGGQRPPHLPALQDLAYTLQTGREEFAERLGFTADGLNELYEKLSRFVQGTLEPDQYYRGSAEMVEETGGPLGGIAEKSGPENLRSASADELLRGWTAGERVDWNQLYDTDLPYRIPLPTYPFQRERYWVQTPNPEVDLVTNP
ncbi:MULTISPECIES: non-ribosomal peptide synthetase [Paenibacillus]|uniref:non-ribosomal peptide synthetase n=1 Tax=Paenibacillus TaxID=44249 RepID=UPI0022B8EB71|nr:non-ribosomal peptide synthetase [Paenibacillus caseinilyticus]MCZ8522694.1 amino acid adenylation domain-containing protein [Paenibacillus caseinilyticus]